MNHKTKLAILGGTGKSGKYLVNQLLAQGFHIRLLLRNAAATKFGSELIEIFQGDVRDYLSVQSWLEGCEAVISTLGQPRGESTIFSQATRNIIQGMNHHHIDRYILTTGLNVDARGDKKGSKTKMATDWMKQNYPETTFDKQVEYEVLCQSTIRWTLVRLPLIELTDERRKLLVSEEDCPGDKISANDLASFLIDVLANERFIKKAPFIANT
jgi:putative NADH-flavin reductase